MTKTLRARSSSTAPQQRLVAKKKRMRNAIRNDANKDMPGEQTFIVRETLRAAIRQGLIGSKDGRITARLSRALIEQAKRQTGIKGDTELLELALANVALEDNFPATMNKLTGTIDPDIKLGF
ncbi:hypothetical protein LB553_12840 [Mesorhizobium sp. CA8]|uniref:hypothetical protein n=1 Tax=unclassified Mesorhizobium TaxID=325217 RepID=UPI001CD00567|nr:MULTISPECIES: hypothetical protein [unclassified Mesorhizobium]MBZ9761754.1 hypothetical protein [Mesorhizobium sp. CA8]MBZ9820493.1 hypothetical protein [Mesorhizobium sp. CA4]